MKITITNVNDVSRPAKDLCVGDFMYYASRHPDPDRLYIITGIHFRREMVAIKSLHSGETYRIPFSQRVVRCRVNAIDITPLPPS